MPAWTLTANAIAAVLTLTTAAINLAAAVQTRPRQRDRPAATDALTDDDPEPPSETHDTSSGLTSRTPPPKTNFVAALAGSRKGRRTAGFRKAELRGPEVSRLVSVCHARGQWAL